MSEITTANQMTEREIILNKIANSTGAMAKISEKEDEYAAVLLKKQTNTKDAKTLCVVLIILSFICGMMVSPINGSLGFLGFIALIVCGILVKKNLPKKQDKKIQRILEEIAVLQKDPALSWLPDTYCTVYCYEKIEEYLRNMRADNLKEAINLLETEMHQNRVELYTALNRN